MSKATENTPFFSIVMPTYNRAARILPAVNTVLQQHFSNFEILLIDDGSTDDTKSIMSDLSLKDPRIKYFYKKNQERSIARNFGIAKASGSYIGFLDSDDILYSNHLTIAYDLLNRNKFPEVGHLGYQFIDETGKPLLVRNNFDDSFKKKLIHENIIHGNAIFIRKDVANEINFIPSSDATMSEDWYVWLRLAARYPFHFDNTVTSSVVQHDERSLMNINPDKLIASTNIIVEYLKKDAVFLREYSDKISYHFANHYTFLALTLALTKKRRVDTIKFLLRAIRYDPMVVVRRRFLASLKHLL